MLTVMDSSSLDTVLAEATRLQDEDMYRDAAELLAIDEALDRLATEDPQAAELVRLRFFAGLSVEQAAEMLDLPRSTAYVHWAYAKASLRVLLAFDPEELPS